MVSNYIAKVKGTYGTLPRGYPWVMLPWYAVMGTVFAVFEVHSWFGPAGGTLIFASGVALVIILRNAKMPVFTAHPEGIRLGGQRHRVRIPWPEIREVRISRAGHGAWADFVLAAPPLARRRLPPMAEVLLALIPGSYLFLKPPLLDPVADPARYRVPLWGATAEEVADGLRPLVPDSIPIVL
jgi:hypothetical protein